MMSLSLRSEASSSMLQLWVQEDCELCLVFEVVARCLITGISSYCTYFLSNLVDSKLC